MNIQINEMVRMNQFSRINIVIRHSIIILGLVGNVLMFLVYHQGSSLRRLSVSIYFRCFAVLCALQNIYNFLLIQDLTQFADNSEFLFKIKNYLISLINPILIWLEIVASFDRFLTIVYPMKFTFIRRRLCQYLCILIVVFCNMAYYSIILFKSRRIRYEEGENLDSVTSLSSLLGIMDFLNSLAVPFLLMTVLSAVTFVGVRRAHRRIRQSMRTDDSSRRTSRNIKFGVTMISLNLTFFFFNMPCRVFGIGGFNPYDYMTEMFMFFLFGSILRDFFESYFSIIFFVQLAVNSLVRREVFLLAKRLFGIFQT